ncbi:hypothetical protein CLV35_2080 [Motilibacter peucedani]|uniref:TLP18.3/Psb32/MOLO-1 phosphatase superfamily protein n=1 Tax=Motilibacter peucedani TaxID=598650 RepID=A0A420XQW1_9ACTN|nr:hypothetical protein [Motilibacter peucedani]RKS75606.1 hypothetical protein CLV35_2080 [Motilibacter peucedani]
MKASIRGTRAAVLLVAVLAPWLALGGTASADAAIDRAVQALDGKPGVYVEPGSEGQPLSAAELGQVRSRVQAADTPIFVAALTDANAAALKLHLTELINKVRENGTYAVLSPAGFYAASNRPGVRGAALATQAVNAHKGDPLAAVLDFVDGVDAAAGSVDGGSDGGSGGSSGAGLLGVLGVLAVGGGGALLWSRRRRRQRETAQLEQVRGAAEEDVTALGEDIARLDVPATADQNTRDDYSGALDSYDRAKQVLTAADDPSDLQGVTTALEEGRWRMECVRARLAGKPVPERRPPCFFNPRHGPSVADVAWAPAGGTERTVPACAADAERLAQGGEPDLRQVAVGSRYVPYYEAPAYAGYFGGYYGGWGGGGFLNGLVLGELLGGGLGGGWGYGAPIGYGGGYGDSDGGDSGAGDYGGSGDSGGGDFASGFDLGGGGWGGDSGGGGFDGGGGGDSGGGSWN